LKDVVQELHEVCGFSGSLALLSLLTQQPGMEKAYIGCTTCGGSYHVVITAEEFIELPYQRTCHMFESCIAHGLTAAGLALRIIHIQSQALKQTICRYAYLRVERIDITWNK
jgi:hypothetical protein